MGNDNEKIKLRRMGATNRTEAKLVRDFGDGIVELEIPYVQTAESKVYSRLLGPVMEKYGDDDHQFLPIQPTVQYIIVKKDRSELQVSMLERKHDNRWEIYSWYKLFEDIRVFNTRQEAEEAAHNFVRAGDFERK